MVTNQGSREGSGRHDRFDGCRIPGNASLLSRCLPTPVLERRASLHALLPNRGPMIGPPLHYGPPRERCQHLARIWDWKSGKWGEGRPDTAPDRLLPPTASPRGPLRSDPHRIGQRSTIASKSPASGGVEVQHSNWAVAWATNIAMPSTIRAPRSAASRSMGVIRGE